MSLNFEATKSAATAKKKKERKINYDYNVNFSDCLE